MVCFPDYDRVNLNLGYILTQYRESPKLIHLVKTYLRQVEIIQQTVCELPEYFNLDTAVGDQLTLIGLRLGFPRAHCVCEVQPVFGFNCNDNNSSQSVEGFCAGITWAECSDLGVSIVSIDDDELYRKFLSVRRYQIERLFDRGSLETCLELLWGPEASILHGRHGRVVICPGRPLEPFEEAIIQLYPRVLPIPLGIDVRFHFGTSVVWGFGEGWGGLCDGVGSGTVLETEDSLPIQVEDGRELEVDNLGIGSDWMCATDVKAYDC